MARPIKNNLDYFSHDKDMRNDIKIRNLRRKFQHKGYSIYVMMLEHLSNCDYLQYEWNNLSIELLVPDFDIEFEELIEIINHCVKLNLFEIELGVLFCPKFYDRNKKVLTDRSGFDLNNSRLSQLKRDLLSKSEIKRDLLSKSEINPNLPNKSTQSKVKESKVKESKVKESKVEDSKVEQSKINKLEEYKKNILKQVITDMKVPDDVKYSFVCMLDNSYTIKQKYNVFEYKDTLNKVPGIKEFLELF